MVMTYKERKQLRDLFNRAMALAVERHIAKAHRKLTQEILERWPLHLVVQTTKGEQHV